MLDARESLMDSGHNPKFDGVFGEEESRLHEWNARPPREPLMAGRFGSLSTPFKARDRKSPMEASLPSDSAAEPKREPVSAGR
jgi:hypothetical protein